MAGPNDKVQLDRYRIIEEIGRGGMGTVFRGVQTALDREVAVKMLHDEATEDPQVVRRFTQEAMVIAKLNNPRIVTIFDILEVEGRHFMIMEFVRGETLAALSRRKGQLPLHEACRICAEVCGGLEVAHNQKIIHRDIKPENIMIMPNGDVKIMDFGIARLASGSKIKTQTGRAMGTPRYMSPEQIMARNVDARSDLYSLGVVLYKLCCGRPPFDNKSPIIVARMHLQEEAAPPESHNPKVTAELTFVIKKALAKDPDQRYQSAAELRNVLNDLHTALGGSRPAPTSLPQRALTIADMPMVDLGHLGIGSPAAAARAEYDPTVLDPPPTPLPNAKPSLQSATTEEARSPAGMVTEPSPAVPAMADADNSTPDRPMDWETAMRMVPASNPLKARSDPAATAIAALAAERPGAAYAESALRSLDDLAHEAPPRKAKELLEDEAPGWVSSFLSRARIGRLNEWEVALLGFIAPGMHSVLTSHKPDERRRGWIYFVTSLLIFLLPFRLGGSWIYRSYFSFRTFLSSQDQPIWKLLRRWSAAEPTVLASFVGLAMIGLVVATYADALVELPWAQARLERKRQAEALERMRDGTSREREIASIIGETPGDTPPEAPAAAPTPRVVAMAPTPPPTPLPTPRELVALKPTPAPLTTPRASVTPLTRPIDDAPSAPDNEVKRRAFERIAPADPADLRPVTPVPSPSPLPVVTPKEPISPYSPELEIPALPPILESARENIKTADVDTPLAPKAAELVLPDDFSDDPGSLVRQLFLFRTADAYEDIRFYQGLEALQDLGGAELEEAQIAYLYLGVDVEESNKGLSKRLIADGLLPDWRDLLKKMRRSLTHPDLIVVAGGIDASPTARRELTEKLRFTLGPEFTAAIRQAMQAEKASDQLNGVALAVHSSDVVLEEEIARSLALPDSELYDDAFRWLAQNGIGSSIPILEGYDTAGLGDRAYRNASSKLRLTINAVRKNKAAN